MQTAVMVAGLLAESFGWWLVATRGRSVWRVMPAILGAMGVAGVLARPPVAATEVSASVAITLGAGSGAALFVATRVFVWVVASYEPFHRDVRQKYGQAAEVPLARALALSLLVMVPAEELFWRGLFQERLAVGLADAAAATIAWLCYVAVNLPSRSLPIVAAALVGGALWTVLAWWTGGVLASIGSHILWTGLMLVFPPGAGGPVERAS